MNLSARILKWMGWTVEVGVPDYDKCIYCVAPHTSNWDFLIGELAIHSVGRQAGFLMKSTWFFFPMGCLFRAMGGVPVDRSKKRGTGSLVDAIVARFRSEPRLRIAITPEGTRKRTSRWHTGFLRIAYQADVPILLAAIDFATKHITLTREFHPTGNVDADIAEIKKYFAPFKGKNPENFTAE